MTKPAATLLQEDLPELSGDDALSGLHDLDEARTMVQTDSIKAVE